MSTITMFGPWDAIFSDERLARARGLLSAHEIRLLIQHASQPWQAIDTMPPDDRMVLAYCPPCVDFPNGRMMLWRASILAAQNERTPHYLRYPATHWRCLPDAPIILADTASK